MLQNQGSAENWDRFTGLESKTGRRGPFTFVQGGRLRKYVSTKCCGNTPRKAKERCRAFAVSCHLSISPAPVRYGGEPFPPRPSVLCRSLGRGAGSRAGPAAAGERSPRPARPRSSALRASPRPAGGRSSCFRWVSLWAGRGAFKSAGEGKARRQARPPAPAAPAARHAAARAAAAPLPADRGAPGPPPRSRSPAESARLVPPAARAQPLRAEAV